MAVIHESLVDILEDDTGVGALAGNRIYPQILPQDVTLPAITYARISGPRLRAFEGHAGMAHPRFQINCWAETYDAASDLEDAVRAALDDYTGTVASVNIRAVSLEDDGDIFEPAIGAEVRRRFGRRMDFEVWHDET